MENLLSFASENVIVSVALMVFIIVQVAKQFVSEKRYMSVLALVLGVVGAYALKGTLDFEIFVAGLSSGAVSIVFYDYAWEKVFNKNHGEEPYTKGE